MRHVMQWDSALMPPIILRALQIGWKIEKLDYSPTLLLDYYSARKTTSK